MIGVGRLTPIMTFVLRHRRSGVILKGMAQGANQWCQNQLVYGQLGVLALEFRMIPRTQPGKLAVFEAALQFPWQMTGHKKNTTVHKAKEGRVSVTR